MIARVWAITLTVSDLERAIAFYEGKLGLVKKYRFSDYAGFDCGGVEIGVKTWGKLEGPREGEPSVDLAVTDLDATYTELIAKGVTFEKEPHDLLWGARGALFRDPDGNLLQLTQIDWRHYFGICASA